MKCLSIRERLVELGVTTEEAIRYHLDFILTTEKTIGRPLDLERYRPRNVPVPAYQG